MKWLARFLEVSIVVLAVAGCSSVEASSLSSVEQKITRGTVDEGDPAVVALVSGTHLFCTGTLITPRVVLTAAHCTEQQPISVFFGDSWTQGGTFRDVVDRREHPNFEAHGLKNDVGLLLLAEPAPSSIVPLPIRTEALPASLSDSAVRLVGFGATSAEPLADSGEKREGIGALTVFDEQSFEFAAAPSQTCMGDSGGPAFMTFDGTEWLVGVTSSGDANCEEHGRDMRVDAFAAEFVLPYIDETARLGVPTAERCFLPENCASGSCVFPEDAPAIGYCSSPCVADGECPQGMSCEASVRSCRYTAPSPGAFGTRCATSNDCNTRVCGRPKNRDEPLCTARCLPHVTETCPTNADCVAEAQSESSFVCVPKLTTQSGCGVARPGGPTPSGSVLLVASGLLLLQRRNQRRRSNIFAAFKVRDRRVHHLG